MPVEVRSEAMKEAGEAIDGGDDRGLTRSVEKLEEKVDDLYAEVETELIFEDSKWDDSSMDKFIVNFKKPTDTIDAIDKVLAHGERTDDELLCSISARRAARGSRRMVPVPVGHLACLPIGVESPVEFRWVGQSRSLGGVLGRGRLGDRCHRDDLRAPKSGSLCLTTPLDLFG